MSAITIFTTHLANNQYLFGAYSDLKPVMNEALSRILLKVFPFDEKSIIQLVSCLKKDDCKELLKRAANMPDEDIEAILDMPVSAWIEEPGFLPSLWKQEKEFIMCNSSAIGDWSVFPAKLENTYGLKAVYSQRWNSLSECAKVLVPIAKTLLPDARTVNLVIHDKDLGLNIKHRVFAQAELMDAFGGEAGFSSFKEDMQIAALNVIAFQHNASTEVKMYLLDNQNLKNVNDAVLRMVELSAEVKKQAATSQLSSDTVETIFEKRLQEAYKLLNDKQQTDYIEQAYS